MVAAALLVGVQIAGKATRDALFLSSFDVAHLPAMTAGAAGVSLAATLGFSRAMVRLSPARLLPAALGASAALFLGEYALAGTFPRTAAAAVYLHQAVLGALLLSGFWSMVNERFDPHAARKAMGRIGAGASLGGVIGGLVAWRAASVVSVPSVLLLLAAASLLGIMSVRALRRGAPAGRRAPPGPSEPTATSGLALIRERPYLRSLALLVGACAFLDAVLDYLLGASAASRFGGGAPLLAFFSLFHAGTGLGALALQAAVVRPALARFGVAPTLSLSAVFTTLAGGFTLAWPSFTSVLLLRGGHAVLRNSTFRSAYELLYTPLPFEEKRSAKVIIDVACDRVGTIAGSAGVLAVIALVPTANLVPLVGLGLAAGSVALALSPLFRRGYVDALAVGLRTGAPAMEPLSVVEPTTLLTLASVQAPAGPAEPRATTFGASTDPVLARIADLRSGDPARIRAVLSREPEPDLLPYVLPLLAEEGSAAASAEYLRRAAGRATGQLIDALLDPQGDAVVRRRVARILRDVPTQRAADGLLLGLQDPRFDVRYRSAQALARMRARHPEIKAPSGTVLEAAVKEARRAGDGPRQLEHVFTVLGIVLERDPLRMAHQALVGDDAMLRGTALEYLDNVLPAAVREALGPHVGAAQRPAVSGRSLDLVRGELLRSTAALRSRTRP